VPKAFPSEFRRDVVAVARQSDSPISQVARDFGISESCCGMRFTPESRHLFCRVNLKSQLVTLKPYISSLTAQVLAEGPNFPRSFHEPIPH